MSKISENALQIMKARYLLKDEEGNIIETPEDLFRRVAKTVSQGNAQLEKKFYNLLSSLDFLPNSPTLWGAGTDNQMLSACFTIPVEDSITDIFEAIKQGAWILKMGGGVGYSFSRLRPTGSRVDKTHGISSGPISFMHTFSQMASNIKQGGLRRSAQMGIMRVDHPDILNFIRCKREEGSLSCFNISIGVTDKFMKAVKKKSTYTLTHSRTGNVGKQKAKEVWDEMVENAWYNGEPGVFFIDRANQFNPTPDVGVFETTNPCGEQPLLPFESCNLGSINLTHMVKKNGKHQVSWNKLKSTVRLAVDFLDNIVDINQYPLPQIEEITTANRKIGLGVMGWADMLILLGIPYNSAKAIKLAEEIMEFVDYHAKVRSVELAKEKGPFLNWGKSVYTRGIPKDWRPSGKRKHDVNWDKLSKDIVAHGLRNACVTTVAPTGTLSRICGVSSGIEPNFDWKYESHILDGVVHDYHPIYKQYQNEGKDVPKKVFVKASEVSPEYHVKMQAAFQKFVDASISKTVNLPNSATKEDVAKVYMLAYDLGCKGITIYRDGSRQEQVLESLESKDAKKSSTVHEQVKRPDQLCGNTYRLVTGCGKIYVTINNEDGKPFEVFARLGKAGGCAASQTEGISRLVSNALRSGVDPKQIVKQLTGITCHQPCGVGKNRILSCSDAIGKALKLHLDTMDVEPAKVKTNGHRGACPECGAVIVMEEGCTHCTSPTCPYSECG